MFKKDLQDLNLEDNFLFQKVMSHEKISKLFLQKLLNIEIAEISILQNDKITDPYYDAKGVRFDIYAKDASGKVYNIEMQKSNETQIGKRMRYYQSIIDTNELKVGTAYDCLPESYVIFICNHDPFNENRSIYTFQNMCMEDNKIVLQDSAKKIILYTRGSSSDIDGELYDFLKYCNCSTEAVASTSTGNLTRETHEVVSVVKNERGHEYMTFQEIIDDERKICFHEGKLQGLLEGKAEGLLEGKAEGLLEGEANKAINIALKLLEMNEPIEKISLITELSIEEIKSLIND